MEILGIGIDLVDNARIERSIAKLGDRFLDRIFTAAERAYCDSMRNPTPHYAARFAAKEAVAKAFGCGIGAEMEFHEIEVTRSESGAPAIALHGKAQASAERRGSPRIFLTLSHTDTHSIAQALVAGA